MNIKKYKIILNNKKELYLRIKVNPGMSKTEMKDILEDETIKINIAAPPEKGKANQELLKYLSKEFEVNKNNIKIISGKAERIKLIKINH